MVVNKTKGVEIELLMMAMLYGGDHGRQGSMERSAGDFRWSSEVFVVSEVLLLLWW